MFRADARACAQSAGFACESVRVVGARDRAVNAGGIGRHGECAPPLGLRRPDVAGIVTGCHAESGQWVAWGKGSPRMRVPRPACGTPQDTLPHAHGDGGGVPVGTHAYHAAPDQIPQRAPLSRQDSGNRSPLPCAPDSKGGVPYVHIASTAACGGLWACTAHAGIVPATHGEDGVCIQRENISLDHGSRLQVPAGGAQARGE